MAYFDSSAVSKLYLDEPGSAAVQQTLASCDRAICSRLAEVEVPSAIWRAQRNQRVLESQADLLTSKFRTEFGSLFDLIGITTGVLSKAVELLRRHPLAAYDAVHLASALLVRERVGEPMLFVVLDRRLAAAARAEGFTVPDIPSA